MRPTPQEELAGIRRILADDVAPAVAAEYPQAQLQQVLLSLDRLSANFERATPLMSAENATLARLFRDARAALLTAGLETKLVDRLEEVLAAADSTVAAPAFDLIDTRNRELRGLLSEVIATLDAVPDVASTRLRDEIRKAMRANLDRALAAPGG